MTSSPEGSERTPSLPYYCQLRARGFERGNVTYWPAATLSKAISWDFLKDLSVAIFGKANCEYNYITRSMGKSVVLPKLEALRMAICEVKAT